MRCAFVTRPRPFQTLPSAFASRNCPCVTASSRMSSKAAGANAAAAARTSTANATNTAINFMERVSARAWLRHATRRVRRVESASRPLRAVPPSSPSESSKPTSASKPIAAKVTFVRLSLTSIEVTAPCNPRSPMTFSIAARGIAAVLWLRAALQSGDFRRLGAGRRQHGAIALQFQARARCALLQWQPNQAPGGGEQYHCGGANGKTALARRHAVPRAHEWRRNGNAVTQAHRRHCTPGASDTRMRAPAALLACSVESPAPASCSSRRPAASASSLANSNVQ